MHGMGSRLVEYEKNILALRQAYPGIYIKNMNIYPGPPSQTTKMMPMMVRIHQAIKSDPMLADGFNFLERVKVDYRLVHTLLCSMIHRFTTLWRLVGRRR